MGYSTNFKGTLQFENELVASQLAYLKTILGEDCRNYPEWDAVDLYYIDLELIDDFSGLQWDGAEKTYSMEKLVNIVIRLMKKKWSDFGLRGKFEAQGEDVDDRWELIIENGFAIKKKVVIEGQKVICPHCESHFYIESET